MALSGCATADLDRAGTLSSYKSLARSDGILTHAEVFAQPDQLLAAKTVSLVPTAFASVPATAAFDADQRKLVAGVIDRSVCHGLSVRLKVVRPGQSSDLVVHAVVTRVLPTDAAFAGASKIIGVLPSILVPGVPIPVPRVPIGLGSLTVEAEATDRQGRQVAAIVWGRGADSVTSKARVAADGDAYDLASTFGDDFSELLVSGSNPMKGGPSLPSVHSVMTQVNLGEGDPDCDRFGRNPGLTGMIAGGIGLPPSWTDNGVAAPEKP